MKSCACSQYHCPLLPFFLCASFVLLGWIHTSLRPQQVPFDPTPTSRSEEGHGEELVFNISVPNSARKATFEDEYICTVKKLRVVGDEVFVREFLYQYSAVGQQRPHHFLLYGCETVAKDALDIESWPCNGKGRSSWCYGRKQIPLPLPNGGDKADVANKFPLGIGLGLGGKFAINYIMLEVHFAPELGPTTWKNGSQESAGLRVLAYGSPSRSQYLAGMLTMVRTGFTIPPGEKRFSVDINCRPKLQSPIFPYAYWVHTHQRGQVVSGYVVNASSEEFLEFARWTHRWPQPVVLNPQNRSAFAINPANYLAARCTFDTSDELQPIRWGHKLTDEMCNLFLFYFTSSSIPSDLSVSCVNEVRHDWSSLYPTNSRDLPDSGRKAA